MLLGIAIYCGHHQCMCGVHGTATTEHLLCSFCSHEREVDPKAKSNSLPVARAAAYRSSSGQQPSLPVLRSDSPQPVLTTNESNDQPKEHSEDNRQSLQKRIQLLQDHHLKLLNHIKVFREAIDKVNITTLTVVCIQSLL